MASSPAVTKPALAEAPVPFGASEMKLPRTTGAPSIARANTSSGVCPAGGGGVGAVLFREQEVERDRGDPGVLQRIHQRRETLARPWPLTEPLERFFVDLNDAHGLVERVGARLPALVLVENQVLHDGAGGRANDAGQQREQAGGGRRQCVKSGLARFSHAVLAVPRNIRKEESPVLSSR